MSIRHMSAVWDDPYFHQGDKSSLLVALALADSARSEDGRAWPSIDTIAKKARTSQRGVQEACRKLEKDGKLRVEIGAGDHGTNIYHLLWEVQPVRPAKSAPCKQPAGKAPEIPPEKAPLRCTQSVRNHQEPSESLGKIHSPHGEFIALWVEEYPKYHSGEAYAFQAGKDGAAVKQLLSTTKKEPEELCRIAVAAWKNPAGFHCKSAASICGFNSKINEIRAELNAAKSNGSGRMFLTDHSEGL